MGHGESFFSSCKQVMSLIGRNPVSTVFAHTLSATVLLLGKIMGTASCVLAMSAILHSKYGQNLNNSQHSVAWIMALTALIAYATMSFFSAVFEVAFDSVVVCYLEDVERNSGQKKIIASDNFHSSVQSQKSKQG